MSKRDGLIGISMIARVIAGNLLYRRMVTHLAVVLLLTVITGMLTGALLLGGIYAAWLALIHQGIDADKAMLIIGGAMLLLTLCSAGLTIRFIRKLRDALMPVPALPNIRRIASAFADGFTESGHKEKNR